MKTQYMLFKRLTFLLASVCLACCEHINQIHELDIFPGSKEQHFSGNLRAHDAYSSSSNSITGALFGFILGPILFLSAFACIWFN